MKNKERLEVYKKMPVFAVDEKGFSLITEEEYSWLFDYAVKQAERMRELEDKIYCLKEDLAGRNTTIIETNELVENLWQQNKHYRDVIKDIKENTICPLSQKTAIKTLEGESDET